MAWTNPTLGVTGDLITAARYNSDIVNDLLYLFGKDVRYSGYTAVTVDGGVDGVTEKTLFTQSVAAGILGTTKRLNVKLCIQGYNNRAANDTFTLRIKYGGTTMVAAACVLAGPTVAANRNVYCEFSLLAFNATNAQKAKGVWVPECDNTNGYPTPLYGTAGEDSTASKNLVVTAQLANAFGTNVLYFYGFEAELIG